MMGDEQGGGGENHLGRRQEGRALQGVGALTGYVVQAQQRQGDAGDNGPDRQGHRTQAADPCQQDQGQEGKDQQQRTEDQRVGRGPDHRRRLVELREAGGRVRRPVQPEQAEALQQTDGQPDRTQQGRGSTAETVASGRFGSLGHVYAPLMGGCDLVSPACIEPA